jgi:hypothetical protein
MVADFISADHGWLRSPNGEEETRVLFKAGKNREGYFTSDDIIAHAEKAMDILTEHYPNEDHVLVFDNATIHTKRADDALSARRMPKFTSKPDKNWLVERSVTDENGKPVYGPDGRILKEKIEMEDGSLPDGSRQPLYFEDGHPQAGLFKGMAVILEERGLVAESQLRAECKHFKCANPRPDSKCCCRRVLYNQPDFVNVESLLEKACKARGFTCLFLPKFHCELNFLEQCWGYAKRVYRKYPPTSREADLEINVLRAIDSVPIENMRR